MTGGVVVVLGPTGRNFAAGMSGGIAYVLDEDGTFAQRCNHDQVDLEALGPEDERVVRELVDEHRARTGSTVEVEFGAFVKVMPHEYRRALADGAMSSGGEGFLTRETEEVAA
jgi:glutamate synthase domain-containing protein 3